MRANFTNSTNWSSILRQIYRGLCIGGILIAIFSGWMFRHHMLVMRPGYSGGDSFNFLMASRYLTHLSYPENENRLPFFPLIQTVVVHDTEHALDTSKQISLIAGMLTIVLTAVLAFHLTGSLAAASIASVLIAWNSLLVFASVRALSDATFILMALLSMLAAWWYHKQNSSTITKCLFGLLLACTSLTRFEGFIIAAASLGIILVRTLYYRSPMRTLWPVVASYLALIIPWFVSNWFRRGNPLQTGYLAIDYYGSDSFSIMLERMATAWQMFPLLLGNPDNWTKWLYVLLMALGALYIFRKNMFFAMTLILSTCGLFALVTWWTPRGRFFASQIPLFVIFFVAGGAWIEQNLRRSWLVILGLIFVFYYGSTVYPSYVNATISRARAEYADTRDTAARIEAMKWIARSGKNVQSTTADDDLTLTYYAKQFIYVTPQEFLVKCDCIKFVKGADSHNSFLQQAGFTLSKSFYLPISNSYILLYE